MILACFCLKRIWLGTIPSVVALFDRGEWGDARSGAGPTKVRHLPKWLVNSVAELGFIVLIIRAPGKVDALNQYKKEKQTQSMTKIHVLLELV